MRHVRDSKSRGEIIKGGLTESQAKYRARANRDVKGWNFWAMHRKDY
jgi:hypothetical protein